MISILLPTRGRPSEARTCLDSLGVGENNNLEALLWLDEDDPKLDKYQEQFFPNPHIKMFIKKRIRYKNINVMFNFLAEQATGEWLTIMIDDSYMPNPNWYEIFTDFTKSLEPLKKPSVINIGTDVINFFPIVSRKYFEILGHLSASTAIDDWVRVVAFETGINHDMVGIKPVHHLLKGGIGRDGLTDETSADVEKDRKEARESRIRWNVRRCKNRGDLWRDIDKIKNFNSGIIS